mmetsp:Transcript_41237/g.70573  ORF Transcript_41237/g.70573 Transcript_41237/m.70573 type:complete len:131 (-) Transcript_41237:529-921(-)
MMAVKVFPMSMDTVGNIVKNYDANTKDAITKKYSTGIVQDTTTRFVANTKDAIPNRTIMVYAIDMGGRPNLNIAATKGALNVLSDLGFAGHMEQSIANMRDVRPKLSGKAYVPSISHEKQWLALVLDATE